jgi:TolB-like protein
MEDDPMKRHRRLMALGVVAAGLLLIASVTVLWADTAGSLAKAQQLYGEGKFGEVIDLLTTLAKDQQLSDADAKTAYLLLAKASAGKNFLDQAEIYLKKILEIDPKFELNIKVEPPQLRNVWFKVDEERKKNGPPEKADPGVKTLAVLYFENNSIVDKQALDPLSKGLADMLITDLAKISGLQVVERERIQYILDEIKLEQSEYFNEKSAVRVGKLLGAHVLLMGGFIKSDKKTIRIDARLIKTETGELIKADKVEGNPKKLAQLEGELAIKVASDLNIAVAEKQKAAIHADGGQPLEAVLAYTRGLNFEDEQKFAEAYAAYKQALAVYPKLDAAKERMSALGPLVAMGG